MSEFLHTYIRSIRAVRTNGQLLENEVMNSLLSIKLFFFVFVVVIVVVIVVVAFIHLAYLRTWVTEMMD